MNEPIILIGPMKVGKTMISKLLAERLNCSFASLDRLERTYTQANGFDPHLAALIQAQHGAWA
jgi:shikimate kinase